MNHTVWIVTAPSAIHLGRCLLGSGPTRAAALADAFGESWKSRAQRARVEEITLEEARKRFPEFF